MPAGIIAQQVGYSGLLVTNTTIPTAALQPVCHTEAQQLQSVSTFNYMWRGVDSANHMWAAGPAEHPLASHGLTQHGHPDNPEPGCVYSQTL